MTTTQKIIKYLALAFAIFLIINIFSFIIYGIYGIGSLFGLTGSNDSNLVEIETIKDFDFENKIDLEIDLSYTDLVIQKGEHLKVESNSKYITSKQDNNSIVIKEKNRSWFNFGKRSKLIIYIPEGVSFSNVDIDTGAGTVYIDTIITKELELDMGAGKVEIDYLEASNSASIDGGAGSVTIKNGKINNLDLDVGVGKFIISSKITGKSKIDAGVGSLDVNLFGNIDDYKIRVEKGIGDIRIDKDKADNNTIYGNGENYIDIEGGVGSISISFENYKF